MACGSAFPAALRPGVSLGEGVGRPRTARQHKAGAQGPGRLCDRYLRRVWWELRGGWRAGSQGTRRRCPSWVQGGTAAKQYVLQVAIGQFWPYLATRAGGLWSAATMASTRTGRSPGRPSSFGPAASQQWERHQELLGHLTKEKQR